jgi:hypothetical protein
MQARTNNIASLSVNSLNVVEALKRALTVKSRFRERMYSGDIKSAPTMETLMGVTIHSHEILFKANTIFPFNLFPDTIVIDKEKLTIIERYFFQVAKITSVPIRDILNVEADVGPFFGSIHLTSRYFFTNPHSIRYLKRGEAMRIQKLVQGFIIANERNIDCSSIDKAQLEILLEDLGETNANLRLTTNQIIKH